MNFMQLLNTLDEFLFELMSWLVFYPVTLWRTLCHPFRMMKYADSELAKEEGEQYDETLNPPVFLLATLLISHAIELALVGDSPLVRDNAGLAGLITDDTTLIVFRLLLFSIFPLVMAARLVRAKGETLSRTSLKLPFYSQCYPAAPFALMLSLAATLVQCHWSWAPPAALGLIVAAFLAYGTIQIRWFAYHLGGNLGRGFLHASRAMIEGVLLLYVTSILFS